MVKTNYEQGKIKVVWIERDPEKIYSKMFNLEEEAEQFGETKEDYVIFALEKQKNMEEFSWKLLPYGRYLLYSRLVKMLRVEKLHMLLHVKDALVFS